MQGAGVVRGPTLKGRIAPSLELSYLFGMASALKCVVIPTFLEIMNLLLIPHQWNVSLAVSTDQRYVNY